MPYYYIDDDFSKVQSIDSNLDKFIMRYLCEPINNDKD